MRQPSLAEFVALNIFEFEVVCMEIRRFECFMHMRLSLLIW